MSATLLSLLKYIYNYSGHQLHQYKIKVAFVTIVVTHPINSHYANTTK